MSGAGESVGQAVVRLLSEHGTEIVFGIPGVHTLELFRGLRRYGVRHVLNRHEQGAVFAADGYARASGKVGVALLIEGPGLTNAATAIAQAHHDSVPLLVVSAAPPLDRQRGGWGVLHKLPDQQGLMAALTAHTRQVLDPDELPEALSDALRRLAGGRPRPVHLQIPCDVLMRRAPELSRIRATAARPAPQPGDITRAAAVLERSRSPLILYGGGALDAADAAARFAEALAAPAVMTLNGKGVLPEDHPLSLGTTLPTAAVLDELEHADVVVAVGTEFCDVDYYYAAGDGPRLGGALVRVDIDPDQLQERFPSVAPVRADAGRALAALTATLAGAGRRADDARAAAIRARVRWWEEAQPLLPAVEAVGRALPRDAIVAVDSTQLGYVGQNAWAAWRPRTWLTPAGFGTLGPALPMAIGAHVGCPTAPCVCVCGDGGLFYTLEELATGFDLQAPVTLVLWSNDGYGEMRDEMRKAGIPPIAVEAVAHDWEGIVRGFGWEFGRARDLEELERQVGRATRDRRPTVVETGPHAIR